MIDRQLLLSFLYDSADDCYQTIKTLEESGQTESSFYQATITELKVINVIRRQINKGEFDMKKGG